MEHNTIKEAFGTMTIRISHEDWETSDFAGRGIIYISSDRVRCPPVPKELSSLLGGEVDRNVC